MKATLLLSLVLVGFCPTPSQAQSLKQATWFYVAGAALDNATTFRSMSRPTVWIDGTSYVPYEKNPLLQWARHDREAILVSSIAADALTVFVAKRLSVHHPTLTRTLLLVGGSARIYVGVRNLTD